MVREQNKLQSRKQLRKKPRTIDERNKARDVYVFSRNQGTLRCKSKKLEISAASFGATKPGEKPRHYHAPFTEAQAREICNSFNHELISRR